MFGLNTRQPEAPATQDVLIVLSKSGRADIAPIIDINEERILAAGEVEYSIPIEDTKVYIGRRGRVYSFPASDENITDCKNIAALERSTVLQKITLFKEDVPPVAGASMPIGKLIFAGVAVLILIIILAVK